VAGKINGPGVGSALLICFGALVLAKSWDGNRWVGGVPLAIGLLWLTLLIVIGLLRR
jgi:hypothetical protein